MAINDSERDYQVRHSFVTSEQSSNTDELSVFSNEP